MNLSQKIADALGFVPKEKAAIPSVSSTSGSDPFAIWKGSKKVDPGRAFDVYTGWVYACIRAISEEIAKMRFRLMQVNDDGTEEEIFEHELLDLLEGVNPNQTGMELRYTLAAHLEAIGNGYLYLEGVKDETTKPTALYLLDASRTKIKVNREVFPGIVEGFEMRTSGKVYNFKPEEIIHFKYSDPADPYEGVGTVQSAAQWIDADNYAMEFNRRFFLNGARIGGVIEAQQAYTTDQLEYMKKSFENAFKGVENAHKILALPTGTKYQEMGQTQKDMDFSNMMMMMRDRILAAFRVPRTALGITDDVNRANAEATDYVFAARTIAPKMEILCSYLNEFLVPRYGDNLYLSFADPVPENRDLIIREMQAALASSPAISVNEARERYFGLDGINNGDSVMTTFNMVPLGKSEGKKMNKPAIKSTPAQRRKAKNARSAEVRHSIAKTLAESVAKQIAKDKRIVKQVKAGKKDITTMSDDEFEAVYKTFASRVMPYEKQLAEAIRTFNAKQEKEVRDNLSSAVKAFKTKGINPADLADSDAALAAIVDLASPILLDLFGTEGKEAAALLGFSDLDPLTPEVRKALLKAIELMANSYNDETLALLQSKLEQGISEGMGLAELEDLVGEIYAFSDQTRAERVARTETFRVANEATKEAWKQTGVVKTIKWYTAADERVCPYCEPQHGKVVSVDGTFYKNGDTVQGNDGSTLDLSYSDVGAPPLHVQCRCYIRPEEISLE